LRRAPILTSALLTIAGVALFAGTASAQAAGEARGLRYLSWPGRGEASTAAPGGPAVAPPPARTRHDLRRPNTVIPHGGFASDAPAPAAPGLTPAPAARRTLTPANAWMQPPPRPEPAPPVAAPAPAAPVSASPPPSPPPQPRGAPDYLPDAGRGQPVPAEVIYAPAPAAAAPAEAAPFDPMAPRRDAPIFRMQQDAPAAAPAPRTVEAPSPVDQPDGARAPAQPRRVAEVSNSGERPPARGGRYYSVHRQNGRQPDALAMPDPTYVDALVVTMPETIASQDLAAPEQGPTLIRDSQGRVRPAAAASDGDHQ